MLSVKQQKVFSEIEKYIQEYDKSPSVRELQDILGFSSPRAISQYLEILERKGYLKRNPQTRSIYLTKSLSNTGFINIPILGYANCGFPLVYAEEEKIGSLQIDRNLLTSAKSRFFALIAKGDSMNQKTIDGTPIEDGDYLVINKDIDIKNNDPVLAIVDNAATVKTYYRDKDIVILSPESSNESHQPIYLSKENSSLIAGKVVAVLKNPKYLSKY